MVCKESYIRSAGKANAIMNSHVMAWFTNCSVISADACGSFAKHALLKEVEFLD
jgi:hypothetical protein